MSAQSLAADQPFDDDYQRGRRSRMLDWCATHPSRTTEGSPLACPRT